MAQVQRKIQTGSFLDQLHQIHVPASFENSGAKILVQDPATTTYYQYTGGNNWQPVDEALQMSLSNGATGTPTATSPGDNTS